MTLEISSHIAHELRAPLAAVIGTIDAIADPAAALSDDERSELLAAARHEAHHLLGVVERARGRPEPYGAVVLAELARRVLQRFPEVEARTYLRMDRSVTAWTDPDQVDQILTNLFQNVQRYAPDGSVEVEVVSRSDRAELVCRDSGPGIHPTEVEGIFVAGGGRSEQGLHVGLGLSRSMALGLGGDLELVVDERPGATFRLTLPASATVAHQVGEHRVRGSRMKLLVDLARSLSGGATTHLESSLSRLGSDLFGASSVLLLVRNGDEFRVSSEEVQASVSIGDMPMERLDRAPWAPISGADTPWWEPMMRNPHGALVRLESGVVDGVLALGWDTAEHRAGDDDAYAALGVVAGLAVERAALSTELANERLLRSTVMESLPIAVSIFVGDPPQVIDQNRAELQMLGLLSADVRPSDLGISQQTFDVRFADGTPLTIENSPVTEAIRHGKRTGPFFLRVRRADGSEVVTRTYCAPFSAIDDTIVGAIVTSEPISRPGIDRSRSA
jgi:hypothetical protein